jgi:hypothetical protein
MHIRVDWIKRVDTIALRNPLKKACAQVITIIKRDHNSELFSISQMHVNLARFLFYKAYSGMMEERIGTE